MSLLFEKRFQKIALVNILLVIIVIFAGAVVRSTGSGMGCPDWPKCFGHYVPPTTIDALQYRKGRVFKKGYIIIQDSALYSAKKDFRADVLFDPADWRKYTKHPYVKFNPMHTWIEYVNRLLGVCLGFSCILLMFFALPYLKRDKKIFFFSVGIFLLTCFQGWIGANVVHSNLNSYLITVHMFIALWILAMAIYVYMLAKKVLQFSPVNGLKRAYAALRLLSMTLFSMTIVQVLIGTRVREQLDEIAVSLHCHERKNWIGYLNEVLDVHRVLSVVIVLTGGVALVLVCKLLKKSALALVRLFRWNMLLLLLQIFTGVILVYAALPPVAQTIHLLVACLLFGLQFFIIVCLFGHSRNK